MNSYARYTWKNNITDEKNKEAHTPPNTQLSSGLKNTLRQITVAVTRVRNR